MKIPYSQPILFHVFYFDLDRQVVFSQFSFLIPRAPIRCSQEIHRLLTQDDWFFAQLVHLFNETLACHQPHPPHMLGFVYLSLSRTNLVFIVILLLNLFETDRVRHIFVHTCLTKIKIWNVGSVVAVSHNRWDVASIAVMAKMNEIGIESFLFIHDAAAQSLGDALPIPRIGKMPSHRNESWE